MLQGNKSSLYSVEALVVERLMKTGKEGQIMVLSRNLKNKAEGWSRDLNWGTIQTNA